MEDQEVQTQREIKQSYLRDQIISGGYDPITFKDYLDGLKPDGGSNVDIWTLEELTEVVNTFKQELHATDNNAHQIYELIEPMQGVGNTQENELKVAKEELTIKNEESKEANCVVDDEYDIAEHMEYSQLKAPNDSLQKPTVVPSQGIRSEEDRFNKFVNCKKSMRTALNDEKNIEVYIGEYNCSIPQVPKKKNKGNFERHLIAKRIALLEKFLNGCLEKEEIKANQVFLAFLQLNDEEKWKNKKKEADNMKITNNLDENENLKGKVTLQIGPELRDFTNCANEFVNQTEPVYRKMRRLAKQLLLNFEQASNTVFSIGDCFSQLYAASNTFNTTSPMGQNKEIADIYLTLNNLMVTWGSLILVDSLLTMNTLGEQMLGEIKIVEQDLQNFFNLKRSTKILKQRATLSNDFIKFKKTLDAKKEKSFTLGDVNRWELNPNHLKGIDQSRLVQDKELALSLMFPKETVQEYELRDRFAYYNYETYTEFSAMLSKRCKAYMKNFQVLAREQIDNLSAVHIHWADVLEHFSNAHIVHSKHTEIMDRSTVKRPPEINEAMLAGADAD